MKNIFTKSILDEVRNYYSNGKNYLKEEESAIDDIHTVGEPLSNVDDMVWDSLYKGDYQVEGQCVIVPFGQKSEIRIYPEQREAYDENDREVSLSDWIYDSVMKFMLNKNMVAESLMIGKIRKALNEALLELEGENESQSDELLNRFIQLYDEGHDDFRIVEADTDGDGNPYIIIETDRDLDCNITFDQHCDGFTPIGITVVVKNSADYEEYDTPEAIEFAQRMTNDMSDYIEEVFDEDDDDDYDEWDNMDMKYELDYDK